MRRAGFTAGVALAAAVAAAEGTNEVTEVRIEVVASPIVQFERVAKDGANSVTVGRRQLERLSATDLPTALRQVPGVTISRYSPVGAYGGGQGGSVYVRGAGTARPGGEVRVYTEGVPRESGVWSHPLMDIAPVDFAEEITVGKNPQPQRYPGTFAAVDVSLRRRFEEGHEGELNVAGGRFRTLLSAASVGGKADVFDYYAGAGYKYSEGERSHGEAELRNAFARGGWQLSERDYVTYIYQKTDNWARDPGPVGGPRPKRDTFESETDTHVVRWEHAGEHVKGYALGYYESGQIHWHKDHLTDGVAASPAGWANTYWHNYGFRAMYDVELERLTLTGGLDINSEGGRTRNIRERDGARVFGYHGRFFTTAPYVGARYDFDVGGGWTLTPSAGGRYYVNSDFDDELAPCAALTLEREGWQFFVSHARGVHYPGIYVRGTSAGTWRMLEAEVLDTTEAGVRVELADGLAALHASVFRSAVDDRLEMTSSGYLNTGDQEAYGAEVSAHVWPTEKVTLFAGLTYTDPEDKPVSRLPEATASAGVSWQVCRRLRWDVDAQYVSTQHAYSVRTLEPELEKLDDYFVVNTRLALDLRALLPLDGEFYVALENVTDEDYAYFPGYPMPGVMWYAGMKVKF